MRLISILLLWGILSSCNKELREDVVIWGNTPPPYAGMSTAQLHTLVNRIHIDLLGRGATSEELNSITASWREGGLTDSSLSIIVADLQQSSAYFRNIDVLFWGKCLNATDSLTVQAEIDLYRYIRDIALIVGDTAIAYFYEPLIDDLLNLQSGALDWKAGTIGIEDYLARLVSNTVYDNVNMGSENFVLATFENLFFRKPTDYELLQGITMVDGGSGFLFLQDGNSKRDFVEIATHSGPFYEGVVLEAYRHLLGRRPDSPEMIAGLNALGPTSDYQALQRLIITSSSYAQ
ncbi:MAG: hypothetical protein GC205_07680 [Bacteroidetes bacterium]|nr:hypothetical protein [Bacteroidota bacterium]